ncbi:cilia-and flagella-associated protein 96 isoform 2-T2 [Amazona ochrocephala]
MPAEGKSDLERTGLFSEMSYITIGDKYVSHYMRPFNEAASKNKQMLPGGSKTMSALQAGYFDPEFVRVFNGEAYADPVQLRRRYRLAESKKNLGKAFLPSNGDKWPCGLGSYYGTIGGSYPYFSPQVREKVRYVGPGKNFYTNPGKKGTGYGYTNLTIGEQYEHLPDEYDLARIIAKNSQHLLWYKDKFLEKLSSVRCSESGKQWPWFTVVSSWDARRQNFQKAQEQHKKLFKGGPFRLNLYPREYFDMNPYFTDKPLPPEKKSPSEKRVALPFIPSSPAKKAGGMKGGTFDPYPSYSAEPYVVKDTKGVTSARGRQIFHPPPGPKSRPVTSIMTLNVQSIDVASHLHN